VSSNRLAPCLLRGGLGSVKSLKVFILNLASSPKTTSQRSFATVKLADSRTPLTHLKLCSSCHWPDWSKDSGGEESPETFFVVFCMILVSLSPRHRRIDPLEICFFVYEVNLKRSEFLSPGAERRDERSFVVFLI